MNKRLIFGLAISLLPSCVMADGGPKMTRTVIDSDGRFVTVIVDIHGKVLTAYAWGELGPIIPELLDDNTAARTEGCEGGLCVGDWVRYSSALQSGKVIGIRPDGIVVTVKAGTDFIGARENFAFTRQDKLEKIEQCHDGICLNNHMFVSDPASKESDAAEEVMVAGISPEDGSIAYMDQQLEGIVPHVVTRLSGATDPANIASMAGCGSIYCVGDEVASHDHLCKVYGIFPDDGRIVVGYDEGEPSKGYGKKGPRWVANESDLSRPHH